MRDDEDKPGDNFGRAAGPVVPGGDNRANVALLDLRLNVTPPRVVLTSMSILFLQGHAAVAAGVGMWHGLRAI